MNREYRSDFGTCIDDLWTHLFLSFLFCTLEFIMGGKTVTSEDGNDWQPLQEVDCALGMGTGTSLCHVYPAEPWAGKQVHSTRIRQEITIIYCGIAPKKAQIFVLHSRVRFHLGGVFAFRTFRFHDVIFTVTFGTALTWLPFNPGTIKGRREGHIFCTVPVKLPLSFDILKLKCYKFLLSWRYFPCHFTIGHQNSLSFGFSSLINCYIFAGREEKPTWTAFGLTSSLTEQISFFCILLKVKCIQ